MKLQRFLVQRLDRVSKGSGVVHITRSSQVPEGSGSGIEVRWVLVQNLGESVRFWKVLVQMLVGTWHMGFRGRRLGPANEPVYTHLHPNINMSDMT